MYKYLIRPFLFIFQPETVHNLVVSLLKFGFKFPGIKRLTNSIYSVNNPSLRREIFGLKFNNPIGLAAGFDKNAAFFNEFSAFGFSFVEIGTVTPVCQLGNPKPRSFRLKKDYALINRMGFNNKGVLNAKQNLSRRKSNNGLIIGGNIGKNTSTPNSNAVQDYLYCFTELYDYVDYLVINISCPNIKDLRSLQEGEELNSILESVMAERNKMSFKKPVLLKISPDLSNEQIDDIVSVAENAGIDGYIATNTTISRDNLTTQPSVIKSIGNGGLSGLPLRNRSTEVIRTIHLKTQGKKPIIGVGGIMNEIDAYEKLKAGASLVQIYTGFIYSGPSIVKKINKYLINNSL